MRKSNSPPLPSFEIWRRTTIGFRQRLREPDLREPLKRCIDRRYLTVQAICCGVPGRPLMTGEAITREFAEEFRALFQALRIQFSAEVYGRRETACIDERCTTGLWCLILEFATMAGPGARLETSIGCLSKKLEVEIGSDSPTLEQGNILESRSFQTACHFMGISEATNLKCPLGGAAIQINLPVVLPTGKLRAA